MSIIELLYKGIRKPRKALAIGSHKLLVSVGHKKYRRFIVLARSRTGSSLLTSLLDSHLNIHAEGEIFHTLGDKNYKYILTKAFSKQPFYVKAKGFKILYEHPLDDKHSGIWDSLATLDDLFVIHVKRKNIFRTMISRKIAGIAKVWSVRSTDQGSFADRDEITVTFTEDELTKGFEQTRSDEQAKDYTFRNHPMITIYYEDLVNHREQTFSQICEFLGVRYVQPKTVLVKQNTKGMRETVTNYEELKSAFSETEWNTFFSE